MHYTITEAQRVILYKSLMGMPKKGDVAKALEVLQGLLAQPEQKSKLFLRERAQLEQEWCELKKLKEAYTHPAPFTPITADMVTDEMIEECYPEYFSKKDEAFKEMARLAIEPAYNAVVKYMGAKK